MKKLSSFVLIALLGISVSACGAGDPDIYQLSLSDLEDKLSGQESSYKSGSQTRFLEVAESTHDGFKVRMWNDVSWEKTCDLKLSAESDTTTRIIPHCGETEYASGKVPLEFVHTEIRAHVNQIVTGEPIDADAIMMKMTAVTAANLPAMQKEAIAADMQMRRDRMNQSQDDDWGDDDADYADAGWGEQ